MPGKYLIVVLKPDVSEEDAKRNREEVHRLALENPGSNGVGQAWDMGKFKGYALHIGDENDDFLKRIETKDMIKYVEEDSVVILDKLWD
ncbi:hypothetical protein B0H66DRAFT_604052 [Apodospora peruviana]|uniref:Uncharacterized protein n=1 Tax=Apodospora peruviana TaxID=516989 RepID=A0AAE0HZG0_9PEZI|nr:hypothetical protein B0H66DRAFT_604052 [Apodospora peruviana]